MEGVPSRCPVPGDWWQGCLQRRDVVRGEVVQLLPQPLELLELPATGRVARQPVGELGFFLSRQAVLPAGQPEGGLA